MQSPKTKVRETLAIRINRIEDLGKADLPLPVLKDINDRIRDWLASGGSVEDEYVKYQLKYAERIANLGSN